jgi:hypothetical protein
MTQHEPEESVSFRGGIVTREWYEAWKQGYKYFGWGTPTDYTPTQKAAFEQGQLEARNDTLMEGTF